jgi:hypothetical protein
LFIWPKVARGNYELVAKAVAEDGQVSESQRVRVRVEEAEKSR